MLNIQKTLPVRIIGDPVLDKKAKPVPAVTDEIYDLAEKMIRTMYKANGIGLAAPQVGVGLRMFVIHVDPPVDADGNELPVNTPGEAALLHRMPLCFINPEIVSFGTVISEYEEGCLSVPKLYAPVKRPSTIVFRAQILGGEMIELECGGLLARCIQHEYDHLDGIVFVEKAEQKGFAEIKSGLNAMLKKNGHSGYKIKRLV